MKRILAFSVFIILSLAGCALFKNSADPLPRPEMVYIKGGSFPMGDISGTGNTDALPVHTASVDDFYIGKYEVTVAQFNAYARRTNQKKAARDSSKIANSPVTEVSWDQARAYCNYLGYRLPTEPEWEYAARSGGKKQRFAGTNHADSLYHYAHTEVENITRAFPVGLKKPNALDLYDLSGNVFEWVGDYYQLYPKNGNPKWDDLDQRILRVIRGGSYEQPASVASTFYRAGMLHDGRSTDVGFRCAADEK